MINAVAIFSRLSSCKTRAREVIEVEVIDAEVIEAVVIEGGSYRGRRLLREEVIEGGGYRGRKLLREEFIEVEFIEGGSY